MPNYIESMFKQRKCSMMGCEALGNVYKDDFMIDTEGYWFCPNCYDELRDKFKGARQPLEDEMSVMSDDEASDDDCRDLAGITSSQLSKLIDLLPEDMLPLAQKILNKTDEEAGEETAPEDGECDKCHNKLHGGDNNKWGQEHGVCKRLCDGCYTEEDDNSPLSKEFLMGIKIPIV